MAVAPLARGDYILRCGGGGGVCTHGAVEGASVEH